MPRFLLVKTTSLGDVIHNLPAASDLARHRPGASIDWVCETPYAELIACHANIRRVLPINLRHLKDHLFSPAAWREFGALRARIAAERYDCIIDSQGLAKSGWIATFAQGPRAGYAADSAREPMASRFYQRTFRVATDQHAVVRNRLLVAQAAGYPLDLDNEPLDYGLHLSGTPVLNLPVRGYAVFLHATSRADKYWPATHWRELSAYCQAQGWQVVLPWGDERERLASTAIAEGMPGCVIPPRMGLVDAARLLANAAIVAGVDTGLAHLAVAVGSPTIGLYTATHSALTGLHGGASAINLGGVGTPPPVAEVIATMRQLARGTP